MNLYTLKMKKKIPGLEDILAICYSVSFISSNSEFSIYSTPKFVKGKTISIPTACGGGGQGRADACRAVCVS